MSDDVVEEGMKGPTSRSPGEEHFRERSRNDDCQLQQLQRHDCKSCIPLSIQEAVHCGNELTTEHNVGDEERSSDGKGRSELVEGFGRTLGDLLEERVRRRSDEDEERRKEDAQMIPSSEHQYPTRRNRRRRTSSTSSTRSTSEPAGPGRRRGLRGLISLISSTK
jgi:hypothetical protein